MFQQFVGINVIFYYSNVLWEAVGFGESQAFVITVITSITNIVTTLIAIALIDKVGRKPLLLTGSAGMAITLGTMAVIFGTAAQVDGKPVLGDVAGPVALVAANLFVVAFGMSWGPVVWVLLGEMFPNRIRAAALGLAAAGQWVANWLITVTFPQLSNMLGVAYGFYALCAVLSFLFVSRWVQETKGKHPRTCRTRSPTTRSLRSPRRSRSARRPRAAAVAAHSRRCRPSSLWWRSRSPEPPARAARCRRGGCAPHSFRPRPGLC